MYVIKMASDKHEENNGAQTYFTLEYEPIVFRAVDPTRNSELGPQWRNPRLDPFRLEAIEAEARWQRYKNIRTIK